MPTNFDEEKNILKFANDLDTRQCMILSDYENSENYIKTADIISTILSNDYLKIWRDNSHSNLPPDFINEKDSLMMEIMRVDDHSIDGKNNPLLKKEKDMHRELREITKNMQNLELVFCNPVTDLPTEEDHNYRNYYKSFQRTIRKHKSKINKYRTNHPNKKLIFFIMDETSGVYFEKTDDSMVRLHLPFYDEKFIKEFIDSDIDYLIHFCPFNYYQSIGGHYNLPKLIIFDIKHLKYGKMLKIEKYDENRMISSER